MSCSNYNKSIKNKRIYTKPIIKTEQTVNLDRAQKKIVVTAVTKGIKFYTVSCERREEKKNNFDKLWFIEIFGKNPTQDMLKTLNEAFNSEQIFIAAKGGRSIFSSGILIGYKDLKRHEKGDLISISSIKQYNDSTATISLYYSSGSLSGTSKTYKLKKDKSGWKISGCQINAYN